MKLNLFTILCSSLRYIRSGVSLAIPEKRISFCEDAYLLFPSSKIGWSELYQIVVNNRVFTEPFLSVPVQVLRS